MVMGSAGAFEDVSEGTHRAGFLLVACAALLPMGVRFSLIQLGTFDLIEIIFPLWMTEYEAAASYYHIMPSLLFSLSSVGHLCVMWQGVKIARGKGASSLVLHLLIGVTILDAIRLFCVPSISLHSIPLPILLIISLIVVTCRDDVTAKRLKEGNRFFQAARDGLVISIFTISAIATPYAILWNTGPAPPPPVYGWDTRMDLYLTGAHFDMGGFHMWDGISGYSAVESFPFVMLTMIIGIQFLLLSFKRCTVKTSLVFILAALVAWIGFGYLMYSSKPLWFVTPVPITPIVGLLLLFAYIVDWRNRVFQRESRA